MFDTVTVLWLYQRHVFSCHSIISDGFQVTYQRMNFISDDCLQNLSKSDEDFKRGLKSVLSALNVVVYYTRKPVVYFYARYEGLKDELSEFSREGELFQAHWNCIRM